MNQGGFLNPNNWLRHFFRITPPGGGLSGPAF